MDDLSLYVLDITMNSVRAGATEISVKLSEHGQWLDFSVKDNGCGMTEEQLAKKTVSGIHEVLSRGAKVTVICSKNIANEHQLPAEVESIILPDADSLITPFLTATAAQLLAYHTSAHKGLDVDKPRNLAKSVTVE